MLEFKFQDIGEGITEGRLLKWMVKQGDKVKEGDTLFLVETDKVNAEIPSPASGIISETMAGEGDVIYVGSVIVKINTGEEASKEDKPANNDEEENAGVVGALEVSSEVIGSSQEGQDDHIDTNHKILSTPVARKLAKDLGIDINEIKGTGPAGRVMKEDIYSAAENKSKAAADSVSQQKTKTEPVAERPAVKVPELKVSGDIERVPLSTMRKTISKNMALSKSVIPHAAVNDEIDVTKLVQFRSDNQALAESKGVHLTYMPFIVKATALALKDFPIINSSYDMEKEEVVLKKYYNIGVAVDTQEGLMVPVVKDADKKGLFAIGKEVAELSTASRNRTISLDKLQNGTFTITNYGAAGALSGIPVIKYPEAAILGVGSIRKKPVVGENDEIAIRSIMNLIVCMDHRIIDGAEAGRFLARIKEYLENPMLLLMK